MDSSNRPETRPMVFHPKFNEQGHGCPLCGKALKEQDKRRYIHVGQGGVSILRADLPYVNNDPDNVALLSTGPDTGDMGWFEVGSTCAKKLGLEWSKELPPIKA